MCFFLVGDNHVEFAEYYKPCKGRVCSAKATLAKPFPYPRPVVRPKETLGAEHM
jgi:hypothetical protein